MHCLLGVKGKQNEKDKQLQVDIIKTCYKNEYLIFKIQNKVSVIPPLLFSQKNIFFKLIFL